MPLKDGGNSFTAGRKRALPRKCWNVIAA